MFNLASENGVKVLLNGQGADQYLGGYDQFTFAHFANMVKNFKLLFFVNDFKKLQKIKPLSNLALMKGIAFSVLPSFILKSAISIKSSSDHVKGIINTNKLNIEYKHHYDRILVGYETVPEISEHLTFYSTLPR